MISETFHNALRGGGGGVEGVCTVTPGAIISA